MNSIRLDEVNKTFREQFDKPTPLFQDNDHEIYWLGIPEDTAFRSNTYLLVDGKEALIIDPGGYTQFPFVLMRVKQIIPEEQVSGMILCHQDPDVAGSMVRWLEINPAMLVFTSLRTNTLIPNYGKTEYSYYNTDEELYYTFHSGRKLRFIKSPFLHFSGAVTTWDEHSRFLFSGDIWSAIDMDWKLITENFSDHRLKMDLFHMDYMTGKAACRGFLDNLKGIEIKAILPQHGSVIPEAFIEDSLRYLYHLKCGVDLIYPEHVQSK